MEDFPFMFWVLEIYILYVYIHSHLPHMVKLCSILQIIQVNTCKFVVIIVAKKFTNGDLHNYFQEFVN